MEISHIKVKIQPSEIVFLDNIIQGFDGLGLVTTIDAQSGVVIIHVTPGTRGEVLTILKKFPRKIEIID